MKIAIIGAGFCGLSLAWNLLNHRQQIPSISVHLFDAKGIGKGASGIAAGLLHPFSGAHAKLNWKGREGVEATSELLNVSSEALGRPVSATGKGILRLGFTCQQLLDFQRTAASFPLETEWLEADACQALAPGCAESPGLWIKNGITVLTASYLEGLWKASAKRGALFEKRPIGHLSELDGFDAAIITAGAETLRLPELASLPLKLVKGQILEYSWPRNRPPLACALNSHVYLLMTEKGTSCLVGATYEKGYEDALIDPIAALEELSPKAFQLYPPLKRGIFDELLCGDACGWTAAPPADAANIA